VHPAERFSIWLVEDGTRVLEKIQANHGKGFLELFAQRAFPLPDAQFRARCVDLVLRGARIRSGNASVTIG
jgi:hypothetical protein